jgi:hypothetical protein
MWMSYNLQWNKSFYLYIYIYIYCTYLPQTVATIGSDVETLKTKIEELNTFKQTASKQIEEINQKALQVKLLLYYSLWKICTIYIYIYV